MYTKLQELLDYIEKYNVPKDAIVAYQRIEDFYFDRNNWTTIKIKGDNYYWAIEHNENLKKAVSCKENGGDLDEIAPYYLRDDIKPTDLNDERLLDQYVGVSTYFYNKETNTLCITAHY